MECPLCRANNPEVAVFCWRCGRGLRSADPTRHARGHSYAVQPGEGVAQFALISTIMPHTNRRVANNYRWALILAALVTLIFTVAGLLAGAVVAAAFLVPATYLIYIYDVNLWEDTPLPVVLLLFLATGILATLLSLTFFWWLFRSQIGSLVVGGGEKGGFANLDLGALLIFAVLLPVVAEVVKNAAPILLARRPLFDDMIDGFTFGVASGTAYAAFETVVAFAPVFGVARVQTVNGLGAWVFVILNLMIVKSLIYGSATGIAVASFSGRGEGYDGFTPRYYANFAFAAGANVLYWLGVRLLSYAPFGQVLALLWGLVIAGVLVVRVRVMLQEALLEAAVEDAVNERRSKRATTDSGECPECDVLLLPDAMFCIACGASVRATSSYARRRIRESTATGASP